MSVVLALDLGTSKLCALALSVGDDGTCRTLAVRSAPNDTDVPGLPPGRHEQDPARILERALGLVGELVAQCEEGGAVAPQEVAGLCVTGQMHGVVLVDRDLHPVSPLITWRDRRALEPGPGNLEEAAAALDEVAFSRAGCRLHPGYGGLTLHWLSRNGSLPEGARALSLADYVTAALSGIASTELTHAASWGILDVEAGSWDADLVRRLDIPEAVLPGLRPSSMPLGELLGARAHQFGLPPSVRVCSPVGDNQASVVGAAGFAEDACVVNLGTGGQVSVPSAAFRYVPPLETRPMPFGGHILVGASLCGGWSYSYLRRFYQDVAREMTGREIGDAEAYERLNALAEAARPGADGLRADTRFGGARGEPASRGSVTGIDTSNLTPGNLARAVVEGMAEELSRLVGLVAGARVSRIVAGGNAVRKNPLVKDVIEYVFGARSGPLRCPDDAASCAVGPAREEAALGAALCAAVGLGLVTKEQVTSAVAQEDL